MVFPKAAVLALVGVLGGVVVTGCGGSEPIVDQPECCAPPPDTTSVLLTTGLPTTTAAEVRTTEVAVVVTEPDLDGVMPDVLCMDLQDAQNLIQSRGVFFSRSEDASGEGRRQIIDRNWVVVAQTPAAGEPIGERDALLSVLKDDEVSECSAGS